MTGHPHSRTEGPKIAVLTSSDTIAAGEAADLSGDLIAEMTAPVGFTLAERAIVPDERDLIASQLRKWADSGEIDLVCTTGGTGLGPRDVTPEATGDVIDYEVPGITEAIRVQTMAASPMSMLSRARAGVRGRCLILNLPGSTRAVRECLEVVLPVLPHAVEILRGRGSEHPDHGRGDGPR